VRRVAMLCVLIAGLALGAAPAQANREVLSEALLQIEPAKPPLPPKPPAGQIDGACGLFASVTSIYVSDYYNRVINIFSGTGEYKSQIVLPGGPITGDGSNTLDGVCGLAMAPSGQLYGNEWHQGVLRVRPSPTTFDTGNSTGVAVDNSGRVYGDDRTRVAVYDPSGAPVEVLGTPLVIGEGSLTDAYGLAVSADGSRVYVPDAASGTVKVFEPGIDPATPVAQISPPSGFTTLADAALALDPKTGNLLVAANGEPGHEHPGAAIHEFGPPPTYPYLGKIACAPVFGAPSGIATDVSGNLYVTDGEADLSNVFKYGPYTSGSVPTPACAFEGGAGTSNIGAMAAGASAHFAPPASAALGADPAHARSATPSASDRGGRTLVQKGSIRVALGGDMAPTRLPREGTAPISVTVGGQISTTDPSRPPQLRKVSFAFNRAGRLDTKGLPRCRRTDIDPSSTEQALRACGDALVGEGSFAAAVRLPEQSPFPSAGKVIAFNGTEHGAPVVFAHIYGAKPVPTSIVLPLRVRHSGGRFATHLEASLAGLTGEWGYVKSIDLRLGRTFGAGGKRHSFLSAGCPAPAGFPGAVFPLTRASFSFEGGKTLSATLTRNCTVR
jgi:DNA-binding beta-propeller fold protein YncE